MTFFQYIAVYLLTVPVFFIIDMLWLGFIANNLYQSKLANVLGPVNWTAAIIFYLMYIVGILIFAVLPALEAQSLQRALLYGTLFGFFCYATYDMTNLATLRDWPLSITVVDIIWGSVLTGTVAAAGYWLANTFVL